MAIAFDGIPVAFDLASALEVFFEVIERVLVGGGPGRLAAGRANKQIEGISAADDGGRLGPRAAEQFIDAIDFPAFLRLALRFDSGGPRGLGLSLLLRRRRAGGVRAVARPRAGRRAGYSGRHAQTVL